MTYTDNTIKPISIKAFLLGFFCFCHFNLSTQNQKLSDSLEILYKSGAYTESNELMLLQELVDAETNAEKKLTYSLQLIVTANSMDSIAYKYSGYLQKGNAYQMKGDLTKALESYFEASRIADKNNLIDKKGSINISIADAYSIMGDNETSVRYYREALELLEESGDSINLASAQLNLGDEYFNQKKLDSALYLFSESGKIFKAKDFELGEAYNIGNVGLVYAEMGEIEKAEENLNHAVDVLTKLGDYQPICVYLNAISDIFEEKNNTSRHLSMH